jgi:hypothetical protein
MNNKSGVFKGSKLGAVCSMGPNSQKLFQGDQANTTLKSAKEAFPQY